MRLYVSRRFGHLVLSTDKVIDHKDELRLTLRQNNKYVPFLLHRSGSRARQTATTRQLKSKQSQANNRITAHNLLIDFDYDAAFCTEQNTNEQLNSIAGHGQKSHSKWK